MNARMRMAAGWLAAVAGLVWVFHDVQIQPMLRIVRELRWRWIAPAVAVDILSYFTQAFRWKLLLRPVGRLRWVDAAQAVYAGLFASEVLPMRPGEALRTVIVSRRLNTSIAAVAPSVVLERVFDGLWLTIGVAITALLVPLPPMLVHAADVLGVLMLIAVAAFLLLRTRFHHIVQKRATSLAFGLSALLLLGQILAFWLVMIAFGLGLGFWPAAAAVMIIHLGTAIPNAPANIGTYQFFCVVALTLFGVDKTQATGFSLVVFAVLTAPLWLLGSVALARNAHLLSTTHAAYPRR